MALAKTKKPQPTAKVWIDREGNPHVISKMAGDYVANVVCFMLRKHRARIETGIDAGFRALSFVNGEAAQDAIESEIDAMSNLPPLKVCQKHVCWPALIQRFKATHPAAVVRAALASEGRNPPSRENRASL